MRFGAMTTRSDRHCRHPSRRPESDRALSRRAITRPRPVDALQRRPCACGGGCPRCLAEPGAHQPLFARTGQRLSSPNDAHEHEADRVAADVLRMPGPQVPKAAERSPEVSSASHIPPARPGGLPLPEAVRAFFEPRLGHDFGSVRIHTDRRAADSAAALDARAYTVGRDVVFGSIKQLGILINGVVVEIFNSDPQLTVVLDPDRKFI